MKTKLEILSLYGLDPDELTEYKILNNRIFGQGNAKQMFVCLDDDDAEHQRLNELSGKVVRLMGYLLTNRVKNPECNVIISAYF